MLGRTLSPKLEFHFRESTKDVQCTMMYNVPIPIGQGMGLEWIFEKEKNWQSGVS